MEMILRSVISRWLPPATCGVMRHFGSHHSGELAGSGSGSVTSSAAPRIRPSASASASARLSMALPRPALMMMESGLRDAMRSALSRWYVAGVDGTLMAITSAYCSTLSSDSNPTTWSMPSASMLGLRRTPMVSMPTALQSLAKCDPMSPVPIISAVLPSGVTARPASCHMALAFPAA